MELCRIEEVADGCARGFDIGNQRYIVVRQGQDLFVYLNRCPHLGIPLEWFPDQFMDADGEFLRCATHGALFLPDTGECVFGPCTGQFLVKQSFARIDDIIYLK
ncbi:Rieske (2Fe-2S) protein [Saccharophagus sp. K07]|uniref:Rieske (2Fe-2S) protein n=1 Tax=Saccharophagus sp. K07 TaxID=2283636 RepID=UPI001651C49D|nr:Rieske 2Fe-2S domain-containing protein [Saccharophagus sp. K07]MBC6905757.1 Rieske (2Fe-2S) protein [Saccharophagus sp. K07]